LRARVLVFNIQGKEPWMTHLPYRRHTRLAGVYSLADLLAGAWTARAGSPSLPTSARLRRDVGLPALDDERPFYTPFGRKL